MNYSNDIKVITKSIGDKLKALKKEKKYTYPQITDKTGISDRTLRKIFNGYEKLSLNQLCELSRFFKVAPYDLIREGTLKFNDTLIKIENNYGSVLAYSLYFLIIYGFIGEAFGKSNNSNEAIEQYYYILNSNIEVYSFMKNIIDFKNNSDNMGIDPNLDAYVMYQNEIFKKYVKEFNKGFEKIIQDNKNQDINNKK